MDISNPPGLQAHVDDQGPHPNCTIHAVSKALTEGDQDFSKDIKVSVCDSLGIDVNQDQITSDLKRQHAKVLSQPCQSLFPAGHRHVCYSAKHDNA